jgi:hypothetical protein
MRSSHHAVRQDPKQFSDGPGRRKLGNICTRRKKEIKEETQGKCDKQQKKEGRNK